MQSTNREARQVLLNNTDLLLDGKMPNCALRWFTHVAGYEATLKLWEDGDDSDLFSLVPYPPEFTHYVAETFGTLQRRQQVLLKRISGRERRSVHGKTA